MPMGVEPNQAPAKLGAPMPSDLLEGHEPLDSISTPGRLFGSSPTPANFVACEMSSRSMVRHLRKLGSSSLREEQAARRQFHRSDQ